jgi:hypothetical protein
MRFSGSRRRMILDKYDMYGWGNKLYTTYATTVSCFFSSLGCLLPLSVEPLLVVFTVKFDAMGDPLLDVGRSISKEYIFAREA